MPRFFLPSVQDDLLTITGADAAHIAKVLRMRPGESLTVCDGAGLECETTLQSVAPDCVTAQVLERRESRSEPKLRIHLYQGFPKGDKFETIIQKAVELGVTEITPVLTTRCVARPDPKSQASKLVRYNRIAAEAAGQAGRGCIPVVHPFQSFSAALKGCSGASVLFYEGGGQSLRAYMGALEGDTLAIWVGPEGGFEESEVQQAAACGVATTTLGPRILRTETAGPAAISAILFARGEMD